MVIMQEANSLLSDHIDKISSAISFLSTSDNEVIDELGKKF